MSSSVQDDNKEKDILILGKKLTWGVEAEKAEAKYPINST